MIPEIGHFALIVALGIALVQTILPLAGAARGIPSWMAVARPAARAQFVFLFVAFACLTQAFAVNDFSLLYVASNSNSAMPWYYRVTAVWGAHEGSLLLWAFILSIWMVAVSFFSRNLPEDFVARVLGVMGFISAGFLLFMLLTSNPFERLLPAAAEGRELNPLLQDFGLIAHPPMLYMGYVGFSVAFSFAIAALLGGKLDAAWARWSRPWTAVAWMFLTIGIALGSWWAYYELGWGGWWFWDPVENASFMPWLMGTALIHSLAVTEKRGGFKSWTVLLAILAFSLSLLGTFLVRSGVLTSVHAFATDPERGLFILIFLGVVVGVSLALYAWRAPKVGLGGDFALVSREAMLLGNNVLLAVASASVLLGTLYPLIVDALGLGKISVGPPYFNAIFIPLMTPLIFLMGVGPVARWKQASVPELLARLRWALLVSVVTALLLPVALGKWSPMISLGLFMGLWIITSSLKNLWDVAGRNGMRGLAQGLVNVPRGYYGMLFAHLGVAAFALGVCISGGYSQEKELRMEPGQSVEMAGYNFRFDGVQDVTGPNYQAKQGVVQVSKNGKEILVMRPQKRVYLVQRNPTTEADIDAGFLRHLYVALGEPVSGEAWSLRLYYKPFVQWIWTGPLMMFFGGLLAASDRRYRLATRRAPDYTAQGAPAQPALAR
ncbi:MAG: heme lyase CcmF/NrfE family subunit [Gammaproteobacteria bacterium]|nr:heme lyase CcmF/NrfE family subunit [Gammaproteobacteria bacterium]